MEAGGLTTRPLGATSADPFAIADGSAPWLQPYRTLVTALASARPRGADEPATGPLAEVLNGVRRRHAPSCPVHFVPQAELPAGEPYEAFIHRTRQVPTRDLAHDGFNAWVWMVFPAVKLRLNRIQSQAIAAQGVGATRGPVRDAATVFDENGAVLHAPPELWAALERRDWTALFVDLRPLWVQARLVVVGHALLEQLLHPRKPLTAHVIRWPAPCPAADVGGEPEWREWDGALAAHLTAERLASKPFLPLPVLGVPGWWAANEHPGFYADPSVFRPPRGVQASGPSPAAGTATSPGWPPERGAGCLRPVEGEPMAPNAV